MSAQNTTSGIILIDPAGVSIPLPDNQNLDAFAVDVTDTIFTVPATGSYLITYQITTVAAALVTTSILLNGVTTIPASVINETVASDNLSTSFITALTAGDTLQLRVAGVIAQIILAGGASTYLTVVRLT